MTSALQIFTRAIEVATGNSYVSAVTIQPLHMPAYKMYTFTLKQLDGEACDSHSITHSYCEHVVSPEEKEKVIEKLTEKFIADVLRELLNQKLINPKVYEVV